MAQDQLPKVSQEPASGSLKERVVAKLFSPVDIAALVYFRILFGLVLTWESWRYFTYGWIDTFYVNRPFVFSYWPFEFVKPWPSELGMKLHFAAVAVLGLSVAAGFFYRFTAPMLFLAFTYIFLLDKSHYLNHLYLASLLAFLLALVPAHRAFSMDTQRHPQLRTRTVPAWTLWLLRFQLGLPYFFGGIAKINPDWFGGEPLRTWLRSDTDFPLIGPLFALEPTVQFMAYGALVLDLTVVFFLLNRRTRPFAYAAAVTFHFLNSRLFSIGIFPWLMIGATALFFPPDWPRRVVEDLRRRPVRARVIAWWLGFAVGAFIGWNLPVRWEIPQVILGGLGVALVLYSLVELRYPLDSRPAGAGEEIQEEKPAVSPAAAPYRPKKAVLVFLALWAGVHVLLPLRHLAVPGNVYWTEEGQRFSWMMLVRSKRGEVSYVVTDTDRGRSWLVHPSQYLVRSQVLTLADKPDMMVQFAHFLQDRLRQEGYPNVEVRIRTAISLNSAEPKQIIDPNVDLTKVSRPWVGHADFLLPE